MTLYVEGLFGMMDRSDMSLRDAGIQLLVQVNVLKFSIDLDGVLKLKVRSVCEREKCTLEKLFLLSKVVLESGVKLEQGLQMLKLFKGYVSKTSIFDDLGFYETREKIMQERRVKQQQLQMPVLNAKSVDVAGDKNKEGETGKPKSCNSGETNTVLKEVSNIVGVGDNKPSSENGLAPTSENKVVTNGVANRC